MDSASPGNGPGEDVRSTNEAFEYRWLDLHGIRFFGFVDLLKAHARGGWELCGFEYGMAWFKRPIPRALFDSSSVRSFQ